MTGSRVLRVRVPDPGNRRGDAEGSEADQPRRATTKRKTLTFFGNFGSQNLGNECTLQAIIQNARTYLPATELNCVCTNAP
jgi:hypothetical protein